MDLPESTLRDLLLWLLRRRRVVAVTGDSMAPLLNHGARVLMRPSPALIQPGDIVVARHPFQPGLLLIKRVQEITPDGGVFIVGDAPVESSDSRSFGPLRRASVEGVVVSRL